MTRYRGFVLWIGLAAAAFGQIDTGSIVGTVRDSSGASIPNAAITLTNKATNVNLNTTSNDAGEYQFNALHPGSYSVKAVVSGFSAQQFSDVQIDVQTRQSVDFTLQVGNVTQTLEVQSTDAAAEHADGGCGRRGAAAADQRSAAERPPLCGPGAARAGHPKEPDESEQHGSGPLQFERKSGNAELFLARWRGQQFRVHESAGRLGADRAAAARCAAGVSRADPDLLGRVRYVGRRGDQRIDQERDERVSWRCVGVRAQQRIRREYVFEQRGRCRRADISARISSAARSAVRSSRTRLSSFSTCRISPAAKRRRSTVERSDAADEAGQLFGTSLKTPLATAVPSQSGCIVNNMIAASCLDPTALKLLALFPDPNIPSAVARQGTARKLGRIRTISSNTRFRPIRFPTTCESITTSTTTTGFFGRFSNYTVDRQDPPWTGNPIAGNGNFATQYHIRGKSVAISWTDVLSPSMLNEVRGGFSRDYAHSDPLGLTLGTSQASNFGLDRNSERTEQCGHSADQHHRPAAAGYGAVAAAIADRAGVAIARHAELAEGQSQPEVRLRAPPHERQLPRRSVAARPDHRERNLHRQRRIGCSGFSAGRCEHGVVHDADGRSQLSDRQQLFPAGHLAGEQESDDHLWLALRALFAAC